MSGATELIFVHAYYNLPDDYENPEGEWVKYYAPAESDRMGKELSEYIGEQLERFWQSHRYGEYFALADYGNPAHDITDAEEAVFRSALDKEDRGAELAHLQGSDKLRGLRAVILQRVGSGSLSEIRSGVETFNWIVEGAVETVDSENPRSRIDMVTAVEFGPWFVDRLLASVTRLAQTWTYDPYGKFIGESFAPLKPVLDLLSTRVHLESWPRDDLALGRLLLIVDYYNRVISQRSDE
jgi:hypothetical protein